MQEFELQNLFCTQPEKIGFHLLDKVVYFMVPPFRAQSADSGHRFFKSLVQLAPELRQVLTAGSGDAVCLTFVVLDKVLLLPEKGVLQIGFESLRLQISVLTQVNLIIDFLLLNFRLLNGSGFLVRMEVYCFEIRELQLYGIFLDHRVVVKDRI